jgi:ABC-type transport system involved in cytochrome c biogenesis permease subunit
MSDLKTLLGYLSGLAFLQSDIPFSTLVATMLVVNTCDAIMCRLFAHNNGYPKNLWTVIGFVFGIWAVAALIVMPKREKRIAS